MRRGWPRRPLATMPPLPVPLTDTPVTLSRTHGSGVGDGGGGAQLAGPKKLAMIPLAPTFWTAPPSTENGGSKLLMPSLLAFATAVLATASLKFGSRTARFGRR